MKNEMKQKDEDVEEQEDLAHDAEAKTAEAHETAAAEHRNEADRQTEKSTS